MFYNNRVIASIIRSIAEIFDMSKGSRFGRRLPSWHPVFTAVKVNMSEIITGRMNSIPDIAAPMPTARLSSDSAAANAAASFIDSTFELS